MKDIFNKKVFTFNFATDTGATFLLGNFSKFDTVHMTVEFTGLSAEDATVQFVQRPVGGTGWNALTDSTAILVGVNGAGNEELLNQANVGEVGAKITANSETTGTVDIFLTATQN
jgi:hypothetical protein